MLFFIIMMAGCALYFRLEVRLPINLLMLSIGTLHRVAERALLYSVRATYMETIAYIFAAILALIWLWLNVLASFSVRHDATLENFQKLAQTVVIWFVPYLGAAFVLHLIWQQYPSAIPKAWVPWPLNQMIYGKDLPPNQYRDENENPPINGAFSNHGSDFGGFGGDGGSSSD
jgi:hypothetical protein